MTNEKEKEPAPSANGTSPENNFTNKNDNTEKGFCQAQAKINLRWVEETKRLAEKHGCDVILEVAFQAKILNMVVNRHKEYFARKELEKCNL